MAKASVKLFKDGNLIAESGINTVGAEGQQLDVTDEMVDKWADMYRTSKLTLASLKVDSWDHIEFDVDGVVHTRNY